MDADVEKGQNDIGDALGCDSNLTYMLTYSTIPTRCWQVSWQMCSVYEHILTIAHFQTQTLMHAPTNRSEIRLQFARA